MAYRLSTLVAGRTVLLDDGLLEGESARWWDLGRLTDGRLADPLDALADPAGLDALTDAAGVPHGDPDGEVALGGLGPSVPRPRKVFGIGMNFGAHIAEMGRSAPAIPVIFTKWPNCLTGPGSDIVLVGDRTDYEVELVAVIGRTCRGLNLSEAWDALAGVAVDQVERRDRASSPTCRRSARSSRATWCSPGRRPASATRRDAASRWDNWSSRRSPAWAGSPTAACRESPRANAGRRGW